MDWLYPPVCCSCGRIGKLICEQCFSSIELTNQLNCIRCGEPISTGGLCVRCKNQAPHFAKLKSLGYYSGPLRDAVISLKYQRNIGLGDFFSSPLSDIVLKEKWKIELITAIPLNSKRKRERGYNQAEILARPIARRLYIPFSSQLVQRVKSTTSQVGLNLKQRRLNMKDAFEGNPELVKNKTILVVDDVATTGATLDACAKALKEAGCQEVFCLTLAKTIGLQDNIAG